MRRRLRSPPPAGFLDAWIDFNQDGDWIDAGEQIFASLPLAAGPNLLFVTTSGRTRLLGSTTARFRISSKGGLRPTGLASDGEVEDYQVRVLTNTAPVIATPITDVTATEDERAVVIDLANTFTDIDTDERK